MNLINKFIKIFKFLFIDSKFIEAILKVEEIDRKALLVFEKEKQTRINVLLENVQIGDIIWTKRYKTEDDKKNIPLGHDEGPALVLGKCRHGLICSGGMGTIPRNMGLFYKFNPNDYQRLSKDTYFSIFKFDIIDDIRYIKTIGSAKKTDFEKMLLKIKRNKTVYCYFNDERYLIDLFLQCSDIISYDNNKYIVLDILDDKILCLPFDYRGQVIKSRDLEKIDFSKITYLAQNIDYQIIDTINETLYKSILIKYRKYLDYLEKIKIPQRGSVIVKNHIIYYIYGEMGENWLVFDISEEEWEHFDEIIIGKKKFYTNYEGIVIDKKDKFDIIGLATEEEINQIKNGKKGYKHKNKSKKTSTKKNKIYVGNIIEHRYYKGQRFIIIDKLDNDCYCCAIDKIIEGKFEIMQFNRKDIKESNNNSIEGIIWLEVRPKFNMGNIGQHINEIIDTQKMFLRDEISVKRRVKTK